MAKWKLCFVLLLPLTVFYNKEVTAETLVKTIGSKPDVTPICTNSTIITLVLCNIRTERSREGCSLLYQYGQDFEHKCDSRFKLVTDSHTVFLHLMNLTQEDSGHYTCECSHPDGTFTLHLNVTVKEDKDFSSSTQRIPIQRALIGATTFIIIAAVAVGFICRTRSDQDQQSATSGSSVCKTPQSLDPDDPDDPYTSLQHTTSDVYQSVSAEAAPVDHQKIRRKESVSSYTLYENI